MSTFSDIKHYASYVATYLANYVYHKACNAGAESTEILAPNMSEAYAHIFSLHATSSQHFSTPHMELLKLLASYIVNVTKRCIDV